MTIRAECHRAHVLARHADEKYSVELKEYNHLLVLELRPEKHGMIDVSLPEAFYQEEEIERDLESPEQVVSGDQIVVHLLPRSTHVVRWQKLSKEQRVAA